MKKRILAILLVVLVIGLVVSCDESASSGGGGSSGSVTLSPPSWIQGAWEATWKEDVDDGEGGTVNTDMTVTFTFSSDNIIFSVVASTYFNESVNFKVDGVTAGVTITDTKESATVYKVQIVDTDETETYTFTDTSATTLGVSITTVSTDYGSDTETMSLTKKP